MNPVVVDLSHWNSPTDWNAAKASGIQAVICKATEGTWYSDDKYKGYRQKAKESGMLFGAYHFFRPTSVAAQVDYFLKFAQPDENTLLALDHEDEKCTLPMVEEFLKLIEQKTGRKAIIYSGHVLKGQVKVQPASDYVRSHRLWLAQYSATAAMPNGWGSAWLWQYTDSAVVPGFGKVDGNVFGGTNLAEEWAGDGEFVPQPIPPVVQPTSKVNFIAFGGLGGNVFSTGLVTMVNKAKQMPWVDWEGYYPYEAAESMMRTIATWKDPTYVAGHSYGLNNFLAAMRKLPNLKIPGFLAIDSSQYWYGGGPGAVPENVLRVDNYFETTWIPFAIKGSPLYRSNGSTQGITNTRLYARHTEMTNTPEVQAAFIRMMEGAK